MNAQVEVLSPFLPGTKIRYAWDSTTLGALKTCPRMYQYLYIDGWGSTEESVHLRFGSEYHQAFQDYALSRAAGIDHNASVFDVVRELLIRTADFAPNPETRAGKYKSRNILLRAVIWYLDEHEHDPAETYIKADGKPAVELSFRFELDWGPQVSSTPLGAIMPVDLTPPQPYLLCGHLDKVVSLNGALFVMDHKTSMSTLSSNYFDQWSPSNQMTLYSLAAKVIIDAPVRGVILNAAQLMLDYEKSSDYGARFVRGVTYRTPDQLGEWLADLHYWLDLAERYAVEDYFPMNDTACGNYGGCRFRDVCSKSSQVREKFLQSDFHKQTEDEIWNPLRAR